jgi:transcriptional regulator with XRE-family HTH domain
MIESGKTNATLGIIEDLSKALNVEISDLLSSMSTGTNPEIDAKLTEAISNIKKQKPRDQIKLLEAIKTLTGK